jgi:hypothetical protein
MPGDTRRTLRTLRALSDPRAARTSAPIEIQDYLPLPLTTGQKVARAARWAATAIVVAAAATFTAWKSGVAVHSASASAAAGAPAPIVAPARPKGRNEDAAPSAADEPPMLFHRTPAQPSSPMPRRLHKLQNVPRLGSNPSILRKRSSGDVAAVDIARGWLRVGGAGYFGGRVILDGEAVGFAPIERELPIGAHSIAVVSPSTGQTLMHQTIHVGGHHTHLKPLALLH